MVLALVFLLAGAVALAVGAAAVVRGIARIASSLGASPSLARTVLLGLSLEALGAGVVAAVRGQAAMAAGVAYGAAAFLFAGGFGAGLLVAGRTVEAPSPSTILLPGAALAVGSIALFDSYVNRPEGIALIGVLVLYLNLEAREAREARTTPATGGPAGRGPRVPPPALLAGGVAVLALGAIALVAGGVRLLGRTGLSAGFVGAAILGGLAGLREVMREVSPGHRAGRGPATEHLFGTMAALTTGVVGVAALVRPLVLDGTTASAFLVAAALHALVAAVLLARGKAGRLTGAAVLLGYAAWLVWAAGR